MTDLIIPLKGIYFDQIASGEKLEEYRLVTGYWIKRLRNRVYDRVILTRGYPEGGGVEGVTRLTREWRGYEIQALQHEHFGPRHVTVFAIDVSTPARLTPPAQVVGRGG